MKKGYFSKIIVEWYQEHHRDLPWRNTQDAYKIWLSEIILQQTRVSQGLPYYERFIRHYPNVISLAAAREQDVLRLWQGLGYYTRARNLHKCAKLVVKNYAGKFPRTFRELKGLPGIGDYTAAAIASFAFGERVAVVDGNVFRVLSRTFGLDQDIASPLGKKLFSDLANELIPTDLPGIHNQAVMEFGALHCAPQNPNCIECVFSRQCVAFQRGLTSQLPVKIKRHKTARRRFYYLLVQRGNKFLMKKRTGTDIWKGLFDLPMLETNRTISKAGILRSALQGGSSSSVARRHAEVSEEYKHILTHQVIRARFVHISIPPTSEVPPLAHFANGRWYSVRQIERLPKPALITRYLLDRGIL